MRRGFYTSLNPCCVLRPSVPVNWPEGFFVEGGTRAQAPIRRMGRGRGFHRKVKMKKVTVPEIIKMKREGKKIPVLTAYTYSMARILDSSGIAIILVGDSAGMVEGGDSPTPPVLKGWMGLSN